jgi:hypothetical protein
MAEAPAGWWRGPVAGSAGVVRGYRCDGGVPAAAWRVRMSCRARCLRVVASAVLPAAPDDEHPVAGGDADGVRVVLAAVAGGGVDGGGPGAGVPGSVGEVADRVAELVPRI